jgi:hypothetical protein
MCSLNSIPDNAKAVKWPLYALFVMGLQRPARASREAACHSALSEVEELGA